MVASQLLNCREIINGIERIRAKYGSYLLAQAFPEGSPTHPAYGAGHATVAGACVTILKAWFDEDDLIKNPKKPTDDGTMLVDAGGPQLTVGGELNKVVANIAIGRNWGGVHYRSDYTESILLGEKIQLAFCKNKRFAIMKSLDAHLLNSTERRSNSTDQK